jgi:hypothetical protein
MKAVVVEVYTVAAFGLVAVVEACTVAAEVYAAAACIAVVALVFAAAVSVSVVYVLVVAGWVVVMHTAAAAACPRPWDKRHWQAAGST